MDKNNNWQDISNDISDLSKKIKDNLTEESLVGDLKDSLNSTIQASGEILKNITNAVQETIKDEEIKLEIDLNTTRWFDILNINFDLIDGFTKVTDKDAALYCRKLLREEGMFLGNSAGAAIKGVLQLKEKFNSDDHVVVLFHDHGSRYVGKMFNDDWMRKMGYII